MTKLNQVLLAIMLVSVAVVAVAAALLLFSLNRAVELHSAKLGALENESLSTLQDTHKRLNATLTHADVVAGEASHAMKDLAITIKAIRDQQAATTAQTQQMLERSSTLLATANTTVGTLNDSLKDTNDHLGHSFTLLDSNLAALHDTEVGVNGLVPDFHNLLGHLDYSSQQLGGVLFDLHGISTDARQWIHAETRPRSLLKTIGVNALGVGEGVAVHKFWP